MTLAAEHQGRHISVIIPAHNEERALGQLLAAVLEGQSDDLDVVVVCNGCTDNTAGVASRFGQARVIEMAQPSKSAALRCGDEVANYFPRAYVDADVMVDKSSLLQMRRGLVEGNLLACAPERNIRLQESSRMVRWYYYVWQRLPQVRAGLFGRGVVMVSEDGSRRLASLPEVMSDDLALSDAFLPNERAVIREATSVIRPPRSTRDLIRRRVRIATGVAQADDAGLRRPDSKTSLVVVARLAATDIGVAVRLPIFVGITLVVKALSLRAVRQRDFTTWLRDESSRG